LYKDVQQIRGVMRNEKWIIHLDKGLGEPYIWRTKRGRLPRGVMVIV